MLWCCIDMRLADDRPKQPPCSVGALGDYSTLLLRWVVGPTSSARVPGRPQKLLGAEFRVSPGYLLGGVSLPWSGIGGVGVDERVEGAPRRPTRFVLLDVHQVEQAARVCPLVETHRSVAGFDHPNRASHEVDGVRTVSPLAVSSVYLHADRLVHAFFSSAQGFGRDGGGGRPGRILAVSESLTPRSPRTVKRRRTLH